MSSKLRVLVLAVFGSLIALALVAPSSSATSKLLPSTNNLAGVPAPFSARASKCVSESWCVVVGKDQTSGSVVASGDPTVWTESSVIDLRSSDAGEENTGSNELDAVDCVSMSWCLAAGYIAAGGAPHVVFTKGLMLLGDPASWSGQSFIKLNKAGGIDKVQCFSQTSCIAFGRSELGLLYYQGDPETWAKATPKVVEGVESITSLYCYEISSCTALAVIGGMSATLTGDPLTWGDSSATLFEDTDEIFNLGLQSLSCSSPSFCAAIGTSEGGLYVVSGDPSSWTASTGRIWAEAGNPEVSTATGISCFDDNSCTIVGASNVDETLTEQSPYVVQGDPSSINVDNVVKISGEAVGSQAFITFNCLSKTFCMGAFQFEWIASSGSGPEQLPGYDTLSYMVGNPEGWTSESLRTIDLTGAAFGPNFEVQAFDCASKTFCVQVSQTADAKVLIVSGNPSNWQNASVRTFTVSPSFGSRLYFTKLECFSASTCVGVGADANSRSFVVSGNPASWTSSSIKRLKGSGSINGMSCISYSWCALAGVSSDSRLVTILGAPSNLPNVMPIQIKLPTSRFGGGAVWTSISCTSRTYCVAAGNDGRSQSGSSSDRNVQPVFAAGNPAAWTANDVQELKVAKTLGVEGLFTSVSCSDSTHCAAIGNANLVWDEPLPIIIGGNPKNWKSSKILKVKLPKANGFGMKYVNKKGTAFLDRIICQSPTSCTLTGMHLYVSPFVGTINPYAADSLSFVRLTSVPTLTVGSIRGLSCPSTGCLIAGTDNSQRSYISPY